MPNNTLFILFWIYIRIGFWQCCRSFSLSLSLIYFKSHQEGFSSLCAPFAANINAKCEWQWSSVHTHSQFVAWVVNMHPNFLYKYGVLFILANSLLLDSCIISLFITHLFKRFIAHNKRILLYIAHLNFESKKRRFRN